MLRRLSWLLAIALTALLACAPEKDYKPDQPILPPEGTITWDRVPDSLALGAPRPQTLRVTLGPAEFLSMIRSVQFYLADSANQIPLGLANDAGLYGDTLAGDGQFAGQDIPERNLHFSGLVQLLVKVTLLDQGVRTFTRPIALIPLTSRPPTLTVSGFPASVYVDSAANLTLTCHVGDPDGPGEIDSVYAVWSLPGGQFQRVVLDSTGFIDSTAIYTMPLSVLPAMQAGSYRATVYAIDRWGVQAPAVYLTLNVLSTICRDADPPITQIVACPDTMHRQGSGAWLIAVLVETEFDTAGVDSVIFTILRPDSTLFFHHVLRDDGAGGDIVAGDMVWSYLMYDPLATTPQGYYAFRAQAFDYCGRASEMSSKFVFFY